MLIDCHTHIFPDALAPRALDKLVEKGGHAIAPVGTGTAAGLLAHMRRAGLDRAVVCPIATSPAHFDGILAEALAIRDGQRGTDAARHLIPFASVHPADGQRLARLKHVADNGICGIKLHPYYQPCVLDAPEMLEYFRCCRDLGLVVQCHCGFDIGFPPDPTCGPERVARVIREVPGLRFIAAHLGGWRLWNASLDFLLGQDIYLDTALLKEDFGAAAPNRILREHPAERLLFATDWPWLGFEDGIAFIRALGRSPAEEAAILGGNAAALLNLPAA